MKNFKISSKTQLLNPDSTDDDFKEVVASVSRNQDITWLKFVLTDTEPNGNKQRTPKEEFPNLIRTGRFMPIKSATGDDFLDHPNSFAIGSITHLKETEDTIIGIAGLWKNEREEDVLNIKKRFKEGKPIDISWEIKYRDSEIDDESGVETLKGLSLSAATIVAEPAYQGRTPVIAVASESEKKAMDELEKIKKELAEAREEISELKKELKENKETLASQETELKELEELRDYKEQAEVEKERKEKLERIKTQFTEAGIEKDEKYFEENETRLLAMDEETFSFMLQEMVSFSEASASKNKDGKNKTEIPPLTGGEDLDDLDPKKLAQELRKLREKK